MKRYDLTEDTVKAIISTAYSAGRLQGFTPDPDDKDLNAQIKMILTILSNSEIK